MSEWSTQTVYWLHKSLLLTILLQNIFWEVDTNREKFLKIYHGIKFEE